MPASEVARNQRERLFAAAVAIAAESGYEAMTVADILELSGVSRSAFYQHFENKAQCLIAAAEDLIDPALAALAPRDDDGRAREPRRIFEAFFELIRAQPAASRVCFVELHAAGPEGEALADRAFETLAGRVVELAEESSMDPQLAWAVTAGLRKLIHSYLLRDEDTELAALVPELWEWLSGVAAPPKPLSVMRRPRSAAGPGFRGYTPAERIARAVAKVIAEKGYAAMSTDDIAAAASISLTTFYDHFSDKRDAVLGALEMSGAQITALAVPAARRASSWEDGVRILYEAICHYFAAEPAMAQLALVGVYGAGPRALRRRDRVIDSLTEMLTPGFKENPKAPAISPEAAGATVYALMRQQVRSEGPQSLALIIPLATYVTLVGFIGPERAAAVANGARSGKR